MGSSITKDYNNSDLFITISNDGEGDYNCDGTNDHVQIKAAIDAASALSSNGEKIPVHFKPTGTIYNKGDTDIILVDNVAIKGNGAVISNGNSGSLFEATADLDNVSIDGVVVAANTSTSYIINLAGDNTNILIENNKFLGNSGRTIYVGGDATIRNNVMANCWAGIGTKDYKSVSSPDPQLIITGNRITNVDKTGGTEGEAIEVNTHHTGKAIITGNIIKGFEEQGIDCNISNYVVTGNEIEVDAASAVSNTGISVNMDATSGVQPSGVIMGNTITNIGTNGTGIYADFHDGLMVKGNIILGSNSGTPVGRGINLSGGSGNICVSDGNYMQDLAIGMVSDLQEKLMIGLDVFINCTNDTYDGAGTPISSNPIEPLCRFDNNSFYNTTDSPLTWFDAAKIAVATGNGAFIIGRHSNESQEFLSFQIDDTRAKIIYDQDEVSGVCEIEFNIDSTSAGAAYVFQIEASDHMQISRSGVKPLQVTTTQKNALTAEEGAIVYDTTLNKLCVYTGAAWETITSS